MIRKYGLIYNEPRIQDYILGSGSPVKKEVLQADGDWTNYLPSMEKQNGVYMDSMACVTFSALNCIESIMLRKFNECHNFSDRFIAKLSGTTKNGNSFVNVADTIRKIGLIEEEGWVYPNQRRTPPFTWDDYYSDIPASLMEEAKKFLSQYEISYEWVAVGDFEEALKYGPIQVAVKAWYDKDKDGIYESPSDAKINHGTELVKKDTVFDSYEPGIKKLTPDYSYGVYGLQYTINKVTMLDSFLSLFKKKNDTKLVRNSVTGEVAWFYNDSLRIPKSEERSVEMIKQYLIRKEGVSISPEDWNNLPKVEL